MSTLTITNTEKPAVPVNIYIDNINIAHNQGTATYDLNVVNQTFVGYANAVVRKKENSKIAIFNVTNAYGTNVTATGPTPINQDVFSSKAVTLAPGKYSCEILLTSIAIEFQKEEIVEASINYGLTPDYYTPSTLSMDIYLIVEDSTPPPID